MILWNENSNLKRSWNNCFQINMFKGKFSDFFLYYSWLKMYYIYRITYIFTVQQHTPCEVCCWHAGCSCIIIDIIATHTHACGVCWTSSCGGVESWCANRSDTMHSLPLTGGCSSMRKDTSPQTQQWALCSAKWKEWATLMWMEPRGSGMWPTTCSLHRLVTGQSFSHAGTISVFMTWFQIVQWFPSQIADITILNFGQI